MTALVVVQPQRHLRRWVSTALALLVAVAVVCAVCSRPLSDEQLLQAPASKVTPSVAAVEALAVKNAAVQSAVYNTRLMTLINHAQQNKPISLSSVQAVRDLSDSDLTDMIRSAEAHIVTKAQDGAAQLAEKPSAPLSPSGQTAAQRTMQVVSANGGSVDLKSISSAFEAHLEHEMTTAKALMAETSARKHAASRLPAAGADPMSVMKAQLDSSEKAEEDKMKEHFLKERENVIAMFKKHVSAAAPAPAVATPPSPPARHSHKSLANMHMVQHLVFGHQDNVNDAQYGDVPLTPTVSVADRMINRLKTGTSDSDNDVQYGGLNGDINNPTKGHLPSWVSRLTGHQNPASVDDKGLTWRKNYLARLQKIGYRHDEFASDKAPPV